MNLEAAAAAIALDATVQLSAKAARGRSPTPDADRSDRIEHMPGGSDYQGPADALERYVAVVEASGNGEVKGAKNPYTSRNGHMFSFLDADGTMALHLSDELEAEFRSDHDSGPVEQYGRTMRGYSSVPAELLADTAALRDWYDRAWDWIGTLKPKPTKRNR